MKSKIILAIMFLGFVTQGWGQVKSKVFTLDLGEPHKESIRTEDDNSTRLVVRAKELLAFRLINGNPYKYKYVINHKLVNFFEGQGYNPLDSIGKIIGNPNISKQVIGEQTKLENQIKVKEQELKEVEAKINDSNFKSANNKIVLTSRKD